MTVALPGRAHAGLAAGVARRAWRVLADFPISPPAGRPYPGAASSPSR